MEPTIEDLEVEELLPLWVDETGMLIDTMDLMNITAKPRLFMNQIASYSPETYYFTETFTEEEFI